MVESTFEVFVESTRQCNKITRSLIFIIAYSLNFAEACNEKRRPSPELSFLATQQQSSGGEPLETMSDLTEPRIELQTFALIAMSISKVKICYSDGFKSDLDRLQCCQPVYSSFLTKR